MHDHHLPGGGFRNPWPNAAVAGFRAFLKWVVFDRLTQRRPQDPGPPAFRPVVPGFRTPRAAPDAITVTWVGHATFLLQIAGLNVLTDPMWSERASPVQFAGPRRHTPPGLATTSTMLRYAASSRASPMPAGWPRWASRRR
jgi:hypothetical protein